MTIVTLVDGRYWLWKDRLDKHDEHVLFVDVHGVGRLNLPVSLSVFEWGSERYEVQGYDEKGKRWWVEKVEPPPIRQVMPLNNATDPRGDHLPSWRRR